MSRLQVSAVVFSDSLCAHRQGGGKPHSRANSESDGLNPPLSCAQLMLGVFTLHLIDLTDQPAGPDRADRTIAPAPNDANQRTCRHASK